MLYLGDQRSKMEVVPKIARRTGSDAEHPGGELDPAEDVHRRCKKNSPALSCIGKRTREGCDRSSEVRSVHSGRGGEGPVPQRKPKKFEKNRIK